MWIGRKTGWAKLANHVSEEHDVDVDFGALMRGEAEDGTSEQE
jgi:hypothetical protein